MLTDYVFLGVMIFFLRDAALTRSEGIHRDYQERKATFYKVQGYSMIKHIIKSMKVEDSIECVFECLMTPACQSINFQTQGNPTHLCELNNDTLASKPSCNQKRAGFDHLEPTREVTDPCLSSPCKNGAVCTTDICGAHTYQCINCSIFNSGHNCDKWTDPVSSCRDIYEKTNHTQNGSYTFVIDTKPTDVYCQMTELTGCGAGGWTLTMKIDGTKNTFVYDSSYWSNEISYNVTAGKTGLDSSETKMPSYWGVSFSKICIGFTVNGVSKFAAISHTATSLYDVIANGNETRVFLLAKSNWKSLITGSSLQPYCNRQGFNVQTKRVRIGIISNNENNCGSTDSYMGHGGGELSCGNKCSYSYCSQGPKVVPAVGYILVK